MEFYDNRLLEGIGKAYTILNSSVVTYEVGILWYEKML